MLGIALMEPRGTMAAGGSAAMGEGNNVLGFRPVGTEGPVGTEVNGDSTTIESHTAIEGRPMGIRGEAIGELGYDPPSGKTCWERELDGSSVRLLSPPPGDKVETQDLMVLEVLLEVLLALWGLCLALNELRASLIRAMASTAAFRMEA